MNSVTLKPMDSERQQTANICWKSKTASSYRDWIISIKKLRVILYLADLKTLAAIYE